MSDMEEYDERRQEQIIPPDGAEDQAETVELYNVAPLDMPPAAAGANAELGGEAAASRRVAGLPDELANEPEHQPDVATPGAEPFLGYDGLSTDDVIDWIDQADPDPEALREIQAYERSHRGREAVLQEVGERLEADERG